MAKRYPSDLTDAQWNTVRAYFEAPNPKGGRPRTYPVREMVNAILYLEREGCRWRALPDSFPPWMAVFMARKRWSLNGTLERAMSALARARGFEV